MNLPILSRDQVREVDRRAIEDVKRCRGRVIDAPEQVGGWPELPASSAPSDRDADGMPDAWEEAYGLDINDPTDAIEDEDSDGWTNLQEYINSTDPTLSNIPSVPVIKSPADGGVSGLGGGAGSASGGAVSDA